MPFIQNTPESLLARSDSLDPSTTCAGITSAGLPCRRALASSSQSSRIRSSGADERFCWQHRGQSVASTPTKAPARAGTRASLDTLADRLGIVSLEEKKGRGKKAAGGTLSCCLCFSIPIEEVDAGPRPQPRPLQRPEKTVSTPTRPPAVVVTPTKTKPHSSPGGLAGSPGKLSPSPGPRLPSSPRQRVSSSGGHPNQAGGYLDLIPPTTDPLTASLLLAELGRPHVDSEEPGYIYVFWMTPPSRRTVPVDEARELLGSGRGAKGSRGSGRLSDVVGSYNRDAAPRDGKEGKGDNTMLLKIGRASNVQRRMNEWSRQCGYEIEVLRFYPYIPSRGTTPVPSPGSSPGAGGSKAGPRMTPHVKRVERLVHIELAGLGMKATRGKCEVCGREHREWFEVEGSRRGVGRVDEVIRRWTDWDEGI
ncbi:uncharacterized protein DNG_01732 [Cephalotrichum gorgonifer]|uniref:Bacteriophage T5 Orf172 DNA-binding domain-containing protein n=1 Tax=Cephalotrichum gorgonifer TaxID=2041049 RepID=A0AAE8MTR9_9PEZI|nr:uncharacterized protein DNG_01732 [Cephalotrichum gorgonifer]